MTNPTIVNELKRIAASHGGILNAADVVDAARPSTSPLHSRFQWDDSKAAEEYRLLQARQLIRVTVDYAGPADKQMLQRVFVSLTTDRAEGGGYRSLVTVMDDEAQRARLLADALSELSRIREKYEALVELAAVFEVIDTVVPPQLEQPRARRGRRQPTVQPQA